MADPTFDELDALRARLAAAKAGDDPAELEAAKTAVYEFRSYWRTVRCLLDPPEGPAPATLSVKSKVGA
jgi:hypothetical protein